MDPYRATLCLFVLSLLGSSHVFSEGSAFKDAWNIANLYESDKGDYLKLSGRLHVDAADFDASQGDYNDILWRRFRFGFKGKYGGTTIGLEGNFDLNDDLDHAYGRLTDAYLSWNLNGETKLTVLKHSAGFTLDGSTSSKKLLTPQRNNLTNNLWFTAEYFSGVSVEGKLGSQWSYTGAIFSSDAHDEIGFGNASYFTLVSLGKRLTANKLWQAGEVTLDYVYNDVHEEGNTRDFSQVVSLSSKFSFGAWHLWNDLSLGHGDFGQSDIWGLTLMPYYQQTESLQWVARYTWLDSRDVNGLRLGRYENAIVDGRGDRYQEFFGGMNYLFNEHKFKVQLGAQYTEMDDEARDGGEYDGWGATLALRVYW
jgi:phosphate-selective porin OprO/OprP